MRRINGQDPDGAERITSPSLPSQFPTLSHPPNSPSFHRTHTNPGDWPDMVEDVAMMGIRIPRCVGFMNHLPAPGTLPYRVSPEIARNSFLKG